MIVLQKGKKITILVGVIIIVMKLFIVILQIQLAGKAYLNLKDFLLRNPLKLRNLVNQMKHLPKEKDHLHLISFLHSFINQLLKRKQKILLLHI